MDDDIRATSNGADIRDSTEHDFRFPLSRFDLSYVTDF